ncbi:MAG: tetratricopeptide repeat protein [Victivallales bacterium]|nr:tetratricopeptide repeat protein [Victivallales bacterium]
MCAGRFFSHFTMMFLAVSAVCCGRREFVSNDALLGDAVSMASEGKWSEARDLASRAVIQDGKDARARVMLALALEQSGQDGLALEEIVQGADLDPESFMAQFTKGRMLFKRGRYEDCPVPLKKALELKPDSTETLMLLARTNTYLKVHKEAVANFAALAKLAGYRDRPEAYNELGVLFMNQKDFRRALSFFDVALGKDAENVTVNINLAVLWDTIHSESGKDSPRRAQAAENALMYYSKAEKLMLSNPAAEVRRQAVLRRMKDIRRETRHPGMS